MTNWTRIEHTLAAQQLMNEIDANGLAYHNMDHVKSMYEYLHKTEVPYDLNLDWAVLAHDCVYDAEPYKEERSAKRFRDLIWEFPYDSFDGPEFDLDEVERLIELTQWHNQDHPIVRADLHALTEVHTTVLNFGLIMKESMELYGIDEYEFCKESKRFMSALDGRLRVVRNSLGTNAEGLTFYTNVLIGIKLTTKLAAEVQKL